MHGSYKSLLAQYNLIAYGRFTDDDAVIVIVNNSEDERRVKIQAWETGLTDKDDVEQVMVTYDGGFSTELIGYSLPGGCLEIGLRKTSAVVLRKMKW